MIHFLILYCTILLCPIFLLQSQASAKSSIEIDTPLKETFGSGFSETISFFQTTPPIMATENISSHFGQRQNPLTGVLENHRGVDYRAKMGSPIIATASGIVLKAGYSTSYGNLVEIDHGFGITSKYGHASLLMVYEGQMIQKGKVIALVGNSGLSTGPHLHFEIARDGVALNPLNFITNGLDTLKLNQSNQYLNNNKPIPKENFILDKNKIKSYFFTGELIASVRVRSGKTMK